MEEMQTVLRKFYGGGDTSSSTARKVSIPAIGRLASLFCDMYISHCYNESQGTRHERIKLFASLSVYISKSNELNKWPIVPVAWISASTKLEIFSRISFYI